MKNLTVRIEDKQLIKLKYIAYHEGRSASGHTGRLIRLNIEEFESMHGAITDKQIQEFLDLLGGGICTTTRMK